jgi:hypothetical protein
MVNMRVDRQIGISRDLETRGQKLFYEIRASDISTASEMRLKTPNQKCDLNDNLAGNKP